jgi:hypothetical protein
MLATVNQVKFIPATESKLIMDNPPYVDYYRILGLNIKIMADEAQLLSPFRQKYALFLSPPADKTHCSLLLLRNKGKDPMIIVNDEITCVPNVSLLAGYAQMFFVNTWIAKLKGYFLIHAGVLAREEEGIIIMGPSSLGKTTLVLNLVRRGFTFLSDEFAPINRQTKLVEPFPLKIGLRRESAELFPEIDLSKLYSLKNLISRPKWLYDAALLNDKPPRACTVKALIILKPGFRSVSNQQHIIDMALKKADCQVISKLAASRGIHPVFVQNRVEPFIYRFSLKKKRSTIEHFSRICQKYKADILFYEHVRTDIPYFDATPKLKATPKSGALVEICKNLMNFTRDSLLYQEFSANLPGIMVELGKILQDTCCYTLSIGRLGQMTGLLEEMSNNL